MLSAEWVWYVLPQVPESLACSHVPAFVASLVWNFRELLALLAVLLTFVMAQA
jgi:hypothetical protein